MATPRFARIVRATLACALAASLAVASARADEGICGNPFENHYGPFDYRTAPKETRNIVERYHFTDDVEQLRRGNTTKIGGDLTYTLRVFPNHPRALHAMAELARKQKRPRPDGSPYTVECWFERALRFRPDDPDVRMVIGIQFLKEKQFDKAIDQLKLAVEGLPNRSDVHYNLGLAYYRKGDYDSALASAKRAYELGFPLPGLRDMLKKAGKWS
jgi:Tfp pilus assembly protein PilF